ncbi:MAG TPA: GNAT family N-acetyltransferase, partial [Actinomycetota bacterium]|nr:GNAT family N-acetyltransferase [Actinomycetota bacterium]
MTFAVKPVTPNRWGDLERLFGPSGAYSGCWCMFFRQRSAEFSAKAGALNRAELKSLVARKKIPGLLAYLEREPVGWVSVAARQEFGRIERSPVVGPVDDLPAWSIVCLYVAHSHRNKGVSRALVDG